MVFRFLSLIFLFGFAFSVSSVFAQTPKLNVPVQKPTISQDYLNKDKERVNNNLQQDNTYMNCNSQKRGKKKDGTVYCCGTYETFNTEQDKCVCDPTIEGACCGGVKLNTNVPFIGNCIVLKNKNDTGNTTGGPASDTTKVDAGSAFPTLMGGLTKLLMSVILLLSFVVVLVAGVMISASGGSDKLAGSGKKLIGNVIAGLALLGASGVILRLINPNFFK